VITMYSNVKTRGTGNQERLSLTFRGYTPKESCVKSLIGEDIVGSRPQQMIYFRDVFDSELLLKNRIRLSKFAIECDVTEDIVVCTMLGYLANSLATEKNLILKEFGLDLNMLSWMVYHKVDCRMFLHCVGINIDHKNKDEKTCIICNATEHVIDYEDAKVTISPDVHVGDRRAMQFPNEQNNYSGHYVVWAGKHDVQDVNLDAVQLMFGKGKVYWHGVAQYGHLHCHVITGNFHDIRALETMDRCQRSINSDLMVESSEFFHPFEDFYGHCGEDGKDFLITAFLVLWTRLKISHLDEIVELPTFYKIAYPTAFSDIRYGLDNKKMTIYDCLSLNTVQHYNREYSAILNSYEFL